MRLEITTSQRVKNYIYALHAIIIVLAIILTITIFTRDGNSDARVYWYFGLCWLTIPFLVYLAFTPLFSHARKISNVYAFATVDALCLILWLSAWICTAAYVASGKGHGSNTNGSGCENFKYGSKGRCELSTGVTILGVIMMLGFGLTGYLSYEAVMEYKRTGIMPGQKLANDFKNETQGDFDSEMQQEDFAQSQWHGEQIQGQSESYGYQPHQGDEQYAPVRQSDQDDSRTGYVPMPLPMPMPEQPVGPLGQYRPGRDAYR